MLFYENYRISERACCFGVLQFFWFEACCKVEAVSQTQMLRGGMWLKSLWFLECPWLYQAIMELPQIGPTKRGYWHCWGPFVLTALTRLWYSCSWWFDMCIHSACCFFSHILHINSTLLCCEHLLSFVKLIEQWNGAVYIFFLQNEIYNLVVRKVERGHKNRSRFLICYSQPVNAKTICNNNACNLLGIIISERMWRASRWNCHLCANAHLLEMSKWPS